MSNSNVVEADIFDYPKVKNAITGQDNVYINFAGDLERMGKNIVKAMQQTRVKRVIALKFIGVYDIPLKSILIPYRKLVDIIEGSGIDYTILRPDWFTNGNEIDYAITQKGTPNLGSAISSKSIAAFIAKLVQDPKL